MSRQSACSYQNSAMAAVLGRGPFAYHMADGMATFVRWTPRGTQAAHPIVVQDELTTVNSVLRIGHLEVDGYLKNPKLFTHRSDSKL